MGIRVPVVLHNTVSEVFIVWNAVPEDTSQNRTITYIELDIVFILSPIIRAEVTKQVCPRRTRTGCILVPANTISGREESRNSAERIERLKSARWGGKTREEEKNQRALIVEFKLA